MSSPGDIHWIPKGLSYHDDPKEDRLHALLNRFGMQSTTAAVYGSKSAVEKAKGTVSLAVAPRKNGQDKNGLKHVTHFYPVVIRPTEAEDLDSLTGRLTSEELKELKRLIPYALGFNSGNCYARGAAHGSRRGLIVEVDEKRADLMGTKYAVVVTSHRYSVQPDGFQALIPLLLDSEPEQEDLLLEHVMTFDDLEPGVDTAVMLVSNIYSVLTAKHIQRFTSLAVPSPQLDKAETILKTWMEL